MIHRHPVKVRFYELDPYNHLNHAAYIQYFEVGRVELLEHIGFGLAAMQNDGVHLVVTGIQTRFLASAGPHDEVVIETSVDSVRRATTTWSQRLVRGTTVLATQVVDVAATNATGKPTRIPKDLVAAMQPYLPRPQQAGS